MRDLEGIEDLILEFAKKEKMVKIGSLVGFLGINEEIILTAIDKLAERGLIYQPTPESIAVV